MTLAVFQLVKLAVTIWMFQISATGCFYEFASSQRGGERPIADEAVCRFDLQESLMVGPRKWHIPAPPPKNQPRKTYVISRWLGKANLVQLHSSTIASTTAVPKPPINSGALLTGLSGTFPLVTEAWRVGSQTSWFRLQNRSWFPSRVRLNYNIKAMLELVFRGDDLLTIYGHLSGQSRYRWFELPIATPTLISTVNKQALRCAVHIYVSREFIPNNTLQGAGTFLPCHSTMSVDRFISAFMAKNYI